MDKNKVLHLHSTFSIKGYPTKADGGTPDSVFIEGYASTNDVDRVGDVIPSDVWKSGLNNYLKNPIILANHDYSNPVGRMIDHKIDSKGLWIKARISAAAENVFNLIKDGVITAFSVGFKVKDAVYDDNTDVFTVNDLELVEVSVVSIPCNQNTLFSLSKAFDNANDFKKFKKQFAAKGESAKGLESTTDAKSITKKEWNMSPEEIKQMLADAAKNAADEATKSLLAAQAEKAAKEEAERKAQAELETRIKQTVESTIKTVDTGAERLLAEVTKRLEDESQKSKAALQGLEAALKEKADELEKMQRSKMQFTDRSNGQEVGYGDREKAVLLSKITGKSIQDTRFGADLLQKAGQHFNTNNVTVAGASLWELEVSTNLEAEVRRRLVVAPLLRAVQMSTPVMKLPLNPEAGTASWVTTAQYNSTTSMGGTSTANGPQGTTVQGSPHALSEITLSSYKVATNEYLGYEEEEDSIIILLPILRDAMVRRLARAVDKAFLVGAGQGNDPVKGLALYEQTSTVTPTYTGNASIANLRSLRRKLGGWGLDPAELVYIVSTEVYYDLLDDTSFQTLANVGPSATLITGQVGSIGNTPVVVSAEFPIKPTGATTGAGTATTNIGAICVAPGNFIVGNQRGVRFDSQELVKEQQRVMVASLRTGMAQITTNMGMGVSTLRWS